MKAINQFIIIFTIIIMSVGILFAQELIIQENELGFCAVDGNIMTSVGGYTGSGYADTDFGVGKSISWQINVPTDGIYVIRWRYGCGGSSGDRNATLLINGVVVMDTIYFPHTGDWTNWTMSDSLSLNLAAGDNKIRIEAHNASGLGNYDYLSVIGDGVTGSQCTPSYIIASVDQNLPAAGTVSYEPVQQYYEEGTLVTLIAHANLGYFFQSWTGSVTSSDSIFIFPIMDNVEVKAIFLPFGTKPDSALIGYATVQDDQGTPFMVIGGKLGPTVQAASVSDLATYLSSSEPYTVEFSGHLIGTEVISVSSDKILVGVGAVAHLEGIELSIARAQNVIIRNMTISHVTPQDAIEINGSRNVWIDHCDLYSDQEHGEDFYDGLIDIKNESAFITVSWCKIHDHMKAILMASNDDAWADSVARITFHHNYFYKCNSRLPSIRFGKAHIFNNYYQNCNDAINSRMNA